MASCSPSDLLSASSCWQCLPGNQLQAVVCALLCNIWKASNPLASCDVATLLHDAGCFTCLNGQQTAAVQIQLLCEILHAGGGGGSTCLVCQSGAPVIASTCDCALSVDTDNGSFYFWDVTSAAWHQLLGGP